MPEEESKEGEGEKRGEERKAKVPRSLERWSAKERKVRTSGGSRQTGRKWTTQDCAKGSMGILGVILSGQSLEE